MPSGVLELVHLLADYDTPQTNAWIQALLRFRCDGYRTAGRHDGLAYATAPPATPTRDAWLPLDQPHDAYTATRYLEAMEFHFHTLDTVVLDLYRGHDHANR